MKNFYVILSLYVVFFLVSCGSKSEDPKPSTPTTYSIEGLWETSSGNVVTVGGTTCTFYELKIINKYFQAAIDQNYLTTSTPIFKNLTTNGTNAWKADRYRFSYTEDSEGVVTVTYGAFVPVDITISNNGNDLNISGVHPNTFPDPVGGSSFSETFKRKIN